MALARDEHEAQIPRRREDRRPRPHDDVEGALADLEPPPVARPLSPAEIQRDAIPEGLGERARGRGQRLGLGHEDDGPPARRERRRHRVDGDRHLVLRRRAEQERARSAGERREGDVGPAIRRQRAAAGGLVEEQRLRSRRGMPAVGGGRRATRLLDGSLLRRDAWRGRPPDHRRERRDVSLAHPPKHPQELVVEEPHLRGRRTDGQHAGRHLIGGAEHPALHPPAVKRDLHERSDARVQRGIELVGERPVERQERTVDADRHGARQDGPATRGRLGARPRGRSPPRGTPCARSARRRRCPCRSAGAGSGRG